MRDGAGIVIIRIFEFVWAVLTGLWMFLAVVVLILFPFITPHAAWYVLMMATFCIAVTLILESLHRILIAVKDIDLEKTLYDR